MQLDTWKAIGQVVYILATIMDNKASDLITQVWSQDHGTLGYSKSLLNQKDDHKKTVDATLKFLHTVITDRFPAYACN